MAERIGTAAQLPAWLCKEASCGARLTGARTVNGHSMPVDVDSLGVPGGNLAVWREGNGLLRCRVLSRNDDVLIPDEPARDETWGMAHFATCSNPDRFRHKDKT